MNEGFARPIEFVELGFSEFGTGFYHDIALFDMREDDDNNRVLTKGKSPAKVLRKFNTKSGYKARKQFWQ